MVLWRFTIGDTTTQRLLIYKNLIGDLKINNIKLVEYVAYLHIHVPLLDNLDTIATKKYNTTVECWAKKATMSSATVLRTFLKKSAWIYYQTHTYTSVLRIMLEENKEADAASQLMHFPFLWFINNAKVEIKS